MKLHARRVLALWALALVAYANSFGTGFPGDNAQLILGDPRIQAATSANLNLIWTKDYWFGHVAGGVYRPLATMSHLLNYAVLGNGTQPAGYHWFNFLVHAANIALVYVLGLLVLAEAPVAIAMAAIWAVHPVLTESVTNIIGRSDQMAGLGVLAGLVCYILSTRTTGAARRRYVAGVMAAGAVGIFSKENAVVVVAAMLLYDFTFRKSGSWRNRAPGYLALVPPFVLFFVLRHGVLASLPNTHLPPTDNPLFVADFVTARLTALKVLAKYIALLCWPATLSADYSYNQIPLFTAADWPWLLALCAIVALALCAWRWSRPAFFFAAFAFAALAPTANIVLLIGTILGERFLYLPAVGFAGCLAIVLYRLPRPKILLSLICVIFLARTWARNGDWQDQYTLWSSAAQASPNSFKTHLSLASSLPGPDASNIDRVVAEADRVIAILAPLPDKWNSTRAWEAAGIWYRAKGDLSPEPQRPAWYEKSLATLRRGAAVDRAYIAENHRKDLEQGKTPTGAGWFPIYAEIARTELRLGRTAEAMKSLREGEAVAVAPVFFEVLSDAHRQAGNPRQAEVALMQALILSPGYFGVRDNLVRLYQESEPGSCAVSGGNLNLQCALVHEQACEATQNLAKLYRDHDRPADADAMEKTSTQDLACK
jgi:protein O-mannosyl-transferase